MYSLLDNWHAWLWSVAILAGTILLSLVVRSVIFFLLKRLSGRKGSVVEQSLVKHSEKPSRWIFPLLGVLIVLPAAPLPPRVMDPLQHAAGLGLIASVAWVVILVSEVISDMLSARYRVDTADNLLARKVRTQLNMLHRVVVAAVMLVALAIMLMTFPSIRQIGVSVLASAGLVGIVVGMAMRPTISSLIAGIQIAMTQPIRIDDAVVVEGEWGWIEEINSTYVVVRIWDLRRLVLPLSYFLEHPFQNWTRTSADLLGTVFLWVDYTVPVDELRRELRHILESTPKWKGEVCVLQITDASEHSVQLRALMDARDSSSAWDLRCYVREKLIQFLQERYPQSLPRFRGELRTVPGDQDGRFSGPTQIPEAHTA